MSKVAIRNVELSGFIADNRAIGSKVFEAEAQTSPGNKEAVSRISELARTGPQH